MLYLLLIIIYILLIMLINLDYISYWKQDLHITPADLSKLMDFLFFF